MAAATASPNPKDLQQQATSSSPRRRSMANSSLPATKKPGLPPIVRAHDIFNLFALAGLNALNVLYLLGRQSPHTLLWASLLYFVVDVLYVGLFPRCVKSPEVIVGHHIVSICLILIPFNQPQFSWCLSYCMLVEFNTWQLIAKRTIPVASQLQEALFYATWVLLRLVWYPYLIWVFYKEWKWNSLEVGTQWNLILITPVFQTFLTGLNVHWTWALVSKPRERRPKLL